MRRTTSVSIGSKAVAQHAPEQTDSIAHNAQEEPVGYRPASAVHRFVTLKQCDKVRYLARPRLRLFHSFYAVEDRIPVRSGECRKERRCYGAQTQCCLEVRWHLSFARRRVGRVPPSIRFGSLYLPQSKGAHSVGFEKLDRARAVYL